MNRSFIILIGVAIALGVFLTYRATQSGTSLVLTPSQVLTEAKHNPQRLSRIRVAGKVAATEVDYQVKPEIKLAFSIEDPEIKGGYLPVLYRGLKPDMFAPGRDVIIDGHYDGERLVASNLLTQCPSKYEPPTPGAKDYDAKN